MLRPALVLVLCLGLAQLACDDKKNGPDVPPRSSVPAPPLSALAGIDAGALGDPADPPAPAGDLKEELDRFVNVDTCVTERAKLDPLVGDALGAIGYETFLRDACRLLEAAKDKKRETCDRIDSSALRSRCQTWVAIIAQTPDACPMQFEALVTRGRNASCVAIAAKDPRLCVGEGRTVQRATCDAMVARDPAKCDQLLPGQRALCQREVARWRSVLASPLDGLDKLPTVRAKLAVRGTSGTPDPVTSESDLAADFSRGVVVVTQGAAPESSSAPSSRARPRGSPRLPRSGPGSASRWSRRARAVTRGSSAPRPRPAPRSRSSSSSSPARRRSSFRLRSATAR